MKLRDPVLEGILLEELERVKDRIRLLEEELKKKHSFIVKKKTYKGREYYYLYLNRREGSRVVSEYWGRASEKDVKEYKERKAIEEELKKLTLRKRELEKILGYEP